MAMARKEWIQLRRDTRSMILAFALPLFLLIFFGYAISWDVDDVRIAVLDEDGTRSSRELVEAFVSSGYFTLVEHLDAAREVEDRLVRNDVLGVLTIPHGFASALADPGSHAQIQLLLDGSDANTATIARELRGRDRVPARSRGGASGPYALRAIEPRAEDLVQPQPREPAHDRARPHRGHHVDHRGDAHGAHRRP